MMIHTLLHTAEAHRPRFDAIAARIAPGVSLDHMVRPDLLERVRNGSTAKLETEIGDIVAGAPGPVLCTCTTLGEIAERHGAMRIDTPMMEEAARIAAEAQGDILLAYCLESTLAPSIAQLDRELEKHGYRTQVHTLDLSQFWPLFEADQQEAFDAVIATHVREAASEAPDAAVIVLAQASMAGAATRLADLRPAVLSSPEMALAALLGRA